MRRLTPVFPAAVVAFAVLMLPKVWLADGPLYQELLTPHRLLLLSAPSKLLLLLFATLFAARTAKRLGAGNPSASGWWLMAAGLGASCGAQALLTWYQLVLRVPTPYPSAADLLFVPGMLLLVAALVRLLLVFAGSELPLATGREVAMLSAAAAVPLILLGVWLLRPVLAQPAPPLEKALNIAYPVLDCLMLVPTFVLARTTARLRGGRVHRVWTILLGGFLATAAGDVLFAYFTTLDMEGLDPIASYLYVASYGLWAWGAALQRELVEAGDGAPGAAAARA
jgi:hypothetical protein